MLEEVTLSRELLSAIKETKALRDAYIAEHGEDEQPDFLSDFIDYIYEELDEAIEYERKQEKQART